MDVAVAAYDGVFDSGLAAILDVLDGANALRAELENPPPEWHVTTIGSNRQIRTGAGHIVNTEPLARAESADLLIVPALAERRPEVLLTHVTSRASAPVRRLVAEVRERDTPLYTACTGTFLVARAGVLDGLSATTSWWLAPVFRANFPAVQLDHCRMVITSRGVTTAGAAFGHVDLALAVVRRSSPALADLVASYLVVDERPSQSTYTIASTLSQYDPTVSAFERWVRTRLAEPISIPEAAQSLGVSERTLQRTIQRTLGTSPIRFVQDLRVEQASHLLKTTHLTIESIARKVGYENANTLRILLRDRTGKTGKTLRENSGTRHGSLRSATWTSTPS